MTIESIEVASAIADARARGWPPTRTRLAPATRTRQHERACGGSAPRRLAPR